ncbi:MAG: DUF1887 family protein [Alphaproteobacteria bacterium]|nr:MAG: DUF1887 family protein [Alphaproteobacteria bacterium]
MDSIDSLLNVRRSRFVSASPQSGRVGERLELAKLLGHEFDRFDPIRQLFLNSRTMYQPFEKERLPSLCAPVLAALIDLGYIVQQGTGMLMLARLPEARAYVTGAWLEELVGAAAREAGADEVAVSVKIERARLPGCYNEIDVVARTGKRLHFVSCKAYRNLPETYSNRRKPWLAAAQEIRLRCQRYGQRGDTATLVTSLDLFKGRYAREPIEFLGTFARQRRVSVIGFESLRFDDLSRALAEIFFQAPEYGLVEGSFRDPRSSGRRREIVPGTYIFA